MSFQFTKGMTVSGVYVMDYAETGVVLEADGPGGVLVKFPTATGRIAPDLITPTEDLVPLTDTQRRVLDFLRGRGKRRTPMPVTKEALGLDCCSKVMAAMDRLYKLGYLDRRGRAIDAIERKDT